LGSPDTGANSVHVQARGNGAPFDKLVLTADPD
jgi:hypothetical protein